MSSNYYKRTKDPPAPTSYGFKQVSPKELSDILKRVTRVTYSARLHTEEQRQVRFIYGLYEFIMNLRAG